MKEKGFAIALAGGGTRGAYQVGAWKAFLKMGIKIEAVAGASVGAINGVFILQDDYERLHKIYSHIRYEDFLDISEDIEEEKDLFNFRNIFPLAYDAIKQKGFSNQGLRKMLEENLDIEKIYNSSVDFGLSVFSVNDLKTVEKFIEDIEKEKLIDYLLASACFPIYKAQEIDDNKFIDGGTLYNLPINMLLKRGYDNIIAVDLPGVGLKSKLKNEGVNIKVISPSFNLGGIFEFSKDKVERNITAGYIDTLMAFGKLQGYYLPFKPIHYKKMMNDFSVKTIISLEFAAREYGFDTYKIYSKDKFLKKLIETHTKYVNLYSKIKKKPSGIKAIADKFDKASEFPNKSYLIPYFSSIIKKNPTYDSGRELVVFDDYFKAAKALAELEYQFKK